MWPEACMRPHTQVDATNAAEGRLLTHRGCVIIQKREQIAPLARWKFIKNLILKFLKNLINH